MFHVSYPLLSYSDQARARLVSSYSCGTRLAYNESFCDATRRHFNGKLTLEMKTSAEEYFQKDPLSSDDPNICICRIFGDEPTTVRVKIGNGRAYWLGTWPSWCPDSRSFENFFRSEELASFWECPRWEMHTFETLFGFEFVRGTVECLHRS